MTRSRILLIGLLALVLSVAVTLLVNRELQKRFESAEAGESTVVVASERLPLGTRLEEGKMRVTPWPEDVELEGSFRSPAELIGRGVIVPLSVNEPILESKLAPAGAGAGLTSAIPDGMRAVSVKVDDVIGVAGFVLPGSRVDVILSGSPDENRKIEVSKVILENVQVLAAGQNLEQIGGNDEAQSVNVVTLLVTPEDSQKLALASADGRIQLALRNPLDLEAVEPDAIQKASLYRNPAPPRPPERPRVRARAPEPEAAPPPPPPPPAPRTFTVEVIQGSQTEKKSFTEKKDGGNGS